MSRAFEFQSEIRMMADLISIANYIVANQGQNALSSPVVLIQIEVHELHPRIKSFLTLNFHFIHNLETSPKSAIKCYRYEIFRNSPFIF